MLANQDYVRQNITFCQTKRDVSSDKTARLEIPYKWLQKLILLTKLHPNWYKNKKSTQGPELPSCSILPLSLSTCIVVFFLNYSTSKQKFPFVSEAKEGYLSTPPMSYSCMNIS